jgi:serine/threonine protein kinase/tetratricopeptide (TPR) repeat protein
MNANRWTRVAELFDSAVERGPDERAAFLAAECADDPVLRKEVEALLEAHEKAGTFGDSAAFRFEAPLDDGLEPGAHLGRYEIVGFLAAGGMGEVYRAHDPQLGRDVAIKVLRRRGEMSTDQLARFEREARAAGALNHPNIVAVYDTGVQDGMPYVVSELLRGETLRAAFGRGAVPVDRSIEIGRQIVSGLNAAHDKGIVHRDLKPENLFITTEGLVKILDFGLAKQTAAPAATERDQSAITEQGLIVGTTGYMSPEQVRGQLADARSDVFACGALLYEMVAGRRAFDGGSPVETMNAILTTQPPNLSRLPPPFDTIVPRCLAKDPADRYASAHELGAAFDAVVAAGTSDAPSPRSGRTTAWRGAAAAVLGTAIVVSLYLWSTGTRAAIGIGDSGRPTIAIVTFDNPTGNQELGWLTSGLPDMLSIGLAQTSGLDVVSSRRSSAMLQDAGHADNPVSRAHAFEIARRAGAGAVVAGSIYKTSDGFRVDVRVEDPATSTLMAGTSVRGDDVFAIADDLVGRLRGVLNVTRQPAGRPIAEITTHSMEAFRLYTEGYAAVRGLRTNDAREALDAALRLDPGYALAHVALSEAFDKFGDQKRAEEHLVRARALAHRLSERDRLLVEAREAHFAGQTDRTVRALESFVARWPSEDTAWDLLVHAYSRDPALKKRDLDVLHRWRQAVPGPGAGHMHNHFGYAYMDAGRLADAIASFEAYVRVNPKEPNAYDSLGEALLVAARPVEAVRSYDKALSIAPLFGSALAGRTWGRAMSGQLDLALNDLAALEDLGERGGIGWRQVHVMRALVSSRAGRYREASEAIARGLDLSRRLRSIALDVEMRIAAALVALELNQLARARAAAREAIDVLDRNRAVVEPLLDADVSRSLARFALGLADLREGRLEPAERQLEAQRRDDRVDDPRQVWWQHALAGEIAFARGDLDAAERLWRAGLPPRKMHFSMRHATTLFANQMPQRDWQARLRRKRGDLAAAAATYGTLNLPSADTAWTAIVEPRFVLERARLLRQLGDLESSRGEYRRFLELWRDADPDLPELAEARAKS